MAHFHIKRKKRRPYLYVREIARVDGKPKVVSQVYIGSPAKVLSFATGQEQGAIHLKVEEFGALWLAQQINQDIDLCSIVDAVVPRTDREKSSLPQSGGADVLSYAGLATRFNRQRPLHVHG